MSPESDINVVHLENKDHCICRFGNFLSLLSVIQVAAIL